MSKCLLSVIIEVMHVCVPNMQLTRPSKGGWLIPQCTLGSGVNHCHKMGSQN